MRNMPRIYRNFEEFERQELVEEGASIDEMLDEMFADELDVSFTSSKSPPKAGPRAKSAFETLDELDQ